MIRSHKFSKSLLEKRITRLEKLTRTHEATRKAAKPLTSAEEKAIKSWFKKHCSKPKYYASLPPQAAALDDWEDAMYFIADKNDDTIVNTCANELGIQNLKAISDIFGVEAETIVNTVINDPVEYINLDAVPSKNKRTCKGS